MGLRGRIIGGVGANAFGQAVTLLVQLLTPPVFLSHWTLSQYGAWLMLSAVPSYFAMSDIGIVTAVGNLMTMDMGRGDAASANRAFQSALVFMLVSAVAILGLTTLVLSTLPISALRESDYRIALNLLVAGVLLAFFNGMAEAIFRATGRYGLGTALGHAARLIEWFGGVVGLLLRGTFAGVALGMLVGRMLGLLLTVSYSVATTTQIRWGLQSASSAQIKVLIKPATSLMAFPFASALSLQGFTLLIGSLFGSASAAVFNVYRTIARVTLQATSVISFAAGPELSRLYAGLERDVLKRLYERVFQLSCLVAVGVPVAVGLLAPLILSRWTRGRVAYHPSLLWPLLIYAVVSSLGHVPRTLLISVNRHTRLAGVTVLLAAAAVALGWLVGKNGSLIATVWVLAITELAATLTAQKLARRELDGPVTA